MRLPSPGQACWARPLVLKRRRYVLPAGNSLTADVAVIGAGVFGGWTALCLREMGLSVVLIDQYGPGNSKSSSGGEVRGMRAEYGDREYYTRWAIAAMEQWKIREAEFGTKLYFESGVLGVSRAQPAPAGARHFRQAEVSL